MLLPLLPRVPALARVPLSSRHHREMASAEHWCAEIVGSAMGEGGNER